MASFKSYSSPGGFKPIQAPDVASMVEKKTRQQINYMQQAADYNIKERQRIGNAIEINNDLEFKNRQKIFDLDLRNKQAIQNQILGNYEATIANATSAANQEISTLKALSTFSQTAFQTVGAIQQKIDEGRKQAVNDTIYATGISSKEMMELQKLGSNFSDQSYYENDAIRSIIDNTGASIQQIRFLAENSNAKYWENSVALAEQRGYQQAAYIQSNFDTPVDIGNGQTASLSSTEGVDPATNEKVFQQLRRQFDIENPTELSSAILDSKTYPIVRATRNSLLQASNAKYREFQAQEADRAIYQSLEQLTKQEGIDGWRRKLDSETGAARSKFIGRALNFLESKAYSDDIQEAQNYQEFLENLSKTTTMFNGREITYGDLFASNPDYRRVVDAFYKRRDVDLSRINLAEAEKQREFRNQEQDFIDRLAQNPGGYSAADAQAAIDSLLTGKFSGFYSEKLVRMRDAQSVDALEVRRQTQELEALQRYGALTEDVLKEGGYESSVVQKFMPLAKVATAARTNTNNYKDQLESIDQMIANLETIFPGQKQNWTITQRQSEYKSMFLKKVAELQAMGEINAVEIAFDFVKNDFNKKKEADSTWFTPQGFKDLLGRNTTPKAETAARLKSMYNAVGTYGEKVLTVPNALYTAEQYDAAVTTLNQTGEVDGVAKIVGQMLGKSPLVVLSQAGMALGREPLEPPSLQKFATTADPELLQYFNNYRTQASSTRAMASMGTFVPETIPGGFGPAIQRSAQKYGINPSLLAGALYHESDKFSPDVIAGQRLSPSGAIGIAQFMPGTAADMGVTDPTNPEQAIDGAAKYVRWIMDNYSNGDELLAWQMYNSGPGDVGKTRENREYLSRILPYANKFGYSQALSNPKMMRQSMRKYGRVSFERPSSVVYETASGQPGVDLYFESKRFPAVLGGVVKDVSREPGYGNYVVVESTDPMTGQKVDVLYSHLADGEMLTEGTVIDAGDIIGTQGGTGNVRSIDGTIASVDFLEPAEKGSKSMKPYINFDPLRRYVVSQFER